MNHSDVFAVHLKRVSRSFAFCIERLNSPFREWVSLAYILCRLVDTVEDSPWSSSDAQKESFAQFENFVKGHFAEDAVAKWRSSFSDMIPEGEKELLKDSLLFFEDLQSLPAKVKEPLIRTVLDMSRGMNYFSGGPEKGIRLKSLTEANQYCFFVAGIIGELLTELFAASEASYTFGNVEIINAYRFGFFLQKINLLKDQIGDEPQGRFLVPSRQEMRQSLVLEGRGALNYILGLPVARKDYRIFCAWSLFLGLASLPYIDQSWEEKSLHKIPRTKTILVLGKVEFNINSNDKIEKMFDEMLERHFSDLNFSYPISAIATKPWLYNFYHGRLTPEQMQELGLTS